MSETMASVLKTKGTRDLGRLLQTATVYRCHRTHGNTNRNRSPAGPLGKTTGGIISRTRLRPQGHPGREILERHSLCGRIAMTHPGRSR